MTDRLTDNDISLQYPYLYSINWPFIIPICPSSEYIPNHPYLEPDCPSLDRVLNLHMSVLVPPSSMPLSSIDGQSIPVSCQVLMDNLSCQLSSIDGQSVLSAVKY